jgi:hypothetical protein
MSASCVAQNGGVNYNEPMPIGSDVALGRAILFKKIIVVSTAFFLLITGWTLYNAIQKIKGKGLNSRAWRASYAERHLPVPAAPREGWWGVNLPPVHDGQLGIVLPERHVPGYFEIDRNGIQSVRGGPNPRIRLLIVGGSVAAGAYASNLGRTYFSELAHLLSAQTGPVEVDVLATGAWVSTNELMAFKTRGVALKPDYVLFLDGLNDLILFSDRPEEMRVQQYLRHMQEARDIALANHIKVIFSPQPFLPQKKVKSRLEKLILRESATKPCRLSKAYRSLKEGLQKLTQPGEVYLQDFSGVFDKRPKTIFADIWHFSDVGQGILALKMAHALMPILRSHSSPAS